MSDSVNDPRAPAGSRPSWRQIPGTVFDSLVDLFIGSVDLIMAPIQRRIGVTRHGLGIPSSQPADLWHLCDHAHDHEFLLFHDRRDATVSARP